MCCRALLLVIFLMSFSKVKLEDCGIIEQEEIDLNKVADWANNLPALKKQDEQKWNLLQNSLQGRVVNNKYVLSYRFYQNFISLVYIFQGKLMGVLSFQRYFLGIFKKVLYCSL